MGSCSFPSTGQGLPPGLRLKRLAGEPKSAWLWSIQVLDSFQFGSGLHSGVVIVDPPFEDELGDVLEKALKYADLTEDDLAAKAGIEVGRIKDALDYRYDLQVDEIGSLAVVLGLNEVGLLALAEDRYPLPPPSCLPYCLNVISMLYGVGVVNAYGVTRCGEEGGILFDSGVSPRALELAWPRTLGRISAHFITHWDSDHVGASRDIRRRHPGVSIYAPEGGGLDAETVTEGDRLEAGAFMVQVYSTPGHTETHNSYLVSLKDSDTKPFLVAGDTFFAGSIAAGLFDRNRLMREVRRLWESLPGETVVAPGHGPLTTIGTEREFNPFSGSGAISPFAEGLC